MKSAGKQEQSGKGMAGIVSVVGLVLVWGIVWANLPSKDELLSTQPLAGAVPNPPVAQELDLTIPGVPKIQSPPSGRHQNVDSSATVPSEGVADNPRARQIAEVKCEAEVQQVCPDALTGDDRRRCIAQRMKHLSPACQPIVHRRMVRWKDAELYRLACAEDVTRVCQRVEPGDGRILQCLQDHAQDISEPCYQSLPKGQLLLRN